MAIAQQEHSTLLPHRDWKEDVDHMREELHKEHDRHLRTIADFKNYRRRVEHDGNKIAEQSKRTVLLSLLDIVDDMDHAMKWKSHGEQSVIKGVASIQQKLLALLEANEVRPFECLGEAFTPDLHDAVAVTSRTDVEPGTIVEVLHQGYRWKNELLRPAQVQVSE